MDIPSSVTWSIHSLSHRVRHRPRLIMLMKYLPWMPQLTLTKGHFKKILLQSNFSFRLLSQPDKSNSSESPVNQTAPISILQHQIIHSASAGVDKFETVLCHCICKQLSEGGEQVAKSCFIPRLRAITEVKSVPAPSLHFSLYSNFPYFIISIFLPRTITRTCGWDQVSSTYPKGNTVDLLLIIQHL